jgi:hypothetical protein
MGCRKARERSKGTYESAYGARDVLGTRKGRLAHRSLVDAAHRCFVLSFFVGISVKSLLQSVPCIKSFAVSSGEASLRASLSGRQVRLD